LRFTLRLIGPEDTRNNAMIKVSVTDRLLAALLGAGLGGVFSLAVLRTLHDSAFKTEFMFWLRMTAVHSCIVFVLFALWLGIIGPNVRSANGIASCVGAAVVGGLIALFVPFGFVLVITGQAFITSGVATLVYVVLLTAKDR
jgi:hypothetical protein